MAVTIGKIHATRMAIHQLLQLDKNIFPAPHAEQIIRDHTML